MNIVFENVSLDVEYLRQYDVLRNCGIYLSTLYTISFASMVPRFLTLLCNLYC